MVMLPELAALGTRVLKPNAPFVFNLLSNMGYSEEFSYVKKYFQRQCDVRLPLQSNEEMLSEDEGQTLP